MFLTRSCINVVLEYSCEMRALARGLPAAGRLIADVVSAEATYSPR